MSTWRYQATHRTYGLPDEVEHVYEVVEVYSYDDPDDGRGIGWTDAVAPFGETKAELIECLRMMLADVEHFDVFELDGRDP
jgi:cellulase/cellobiase CelA1